MCLRVIAELTRQTLICDINAVECLRTLIISWGRNTLQSRILFSLFAATVCYLEKWQKLTRDDLEARQWLPSPHCSELSRTSDAWGTTISPLSLSQFISPALKTDKAFLCWRQPMLRAVLRETMPQCLFKGRQQGKSLARAQHRGLGVLETVENKGKGMLNQPIPRLKGTVIAHSKAILTRQTTVQLHTQNSFLQLFQR